RLLGSPGLRPASRVATEPQPPGKTPIIGILWPVDRAGTVLLAPAFRRRLADHGYVEGRNVEIVQLWTDGRDTLLGPFTRDLVARKVDVVVPDPPARHTCGGTRNDPASPAAASTRTPHTITSEEIRWRHTESRESR